MLANNVQLLDTLVMADRLPEVHGVDRDSGVLLAVGQQLDVAVHKQEQGLPVAVSLFSVVRPAIDRLLDRAGLDRDPSIAKLCDMVAEIAVGVLVIGEGFDVRYGDPFSPTSITSVTLRSHEPTITEAQVTNRFPTVSPDN